MPGEAGIKKPKTEPLYFVVSLVPLHSVKKSCVLEWEKLGVNIAGHVHPAWDCALPHWKEPLSRIVWVQLANKSQYLFPTSLLVLSPWYLDIGYDGNIYIKEINKPYKSKFLAPKEPVFKHLSVCYWALYLCSLSLDIRWKKNLRSKTRRNLTDDSNPVILQIRRWRPREEQWLA